MAERTCYPEPTIPIIASATIAKNLFVTAGGGLPASSGDPVVGVNSGYDAVSGDQMEVSIGRVVLAVSGAAITQGVQLQANTAGKAITLASGKACGIAMDAATGADEIIKVRII